MVARQWTKGPKSGVDGRVLSRLEAVNSPAAGDRCMSRAIMAALRAPRLGQPPALTAAYAVTVRSLIAVITVLNEQVKALQGQVEENFGHHPDAEAYLSQPGMGAILGARVLGEFGDDPTVTPTARPARTTPPPARSPARRARRRSSPPGSSATTGSPMP